MSRPGSVQLLHQATAPVTAAEKVEVEAGANNDADVDAEVEVEVEVEAHPSPDLDLSSAPPTASTPAELDRPSTPRAASLSSSSSPSHDGFTPSSPPPNRTSVTLLTNLTPKTLLTTMEVSLNSPSTPSTPDSTPWIGGTGLGSVNLGKSGRVIERLMAENDRLRREIKAEITKREELSRSVATARPKMEKLEAENQRLVNIKGMDDGVIRRRERKIDELKAEVEAERSRREEAERRAESAERARDESEEAGRKEMGRVREEARHAVVHAEILQTSHGQLAREYRQRIAGLNTSLRELEGQRDEDRKRLARLDVVAGHMRGETERMKKMHTDLVAVWQKFESAKTLEVETMEDGARKMSTGIAEKEEETLKLAEDMVEVMGRMKWVMNLESLERGVNSPPLSPNDQ
ncbi:hypothetical protein CAC42_3580 [Sphaceloma murrayae]|uniref:SWI5-dependent HO expression protein 3 n=1 Tax=Sphaceloma murrayae TaxID=2082308 RepID=A0A2K1QSW3_9PEZI|nr:hypothetical protein CAC42_3580 [Sphaceloma murrayae]